jgi:hypothetical protein
VKGKTLIRIGARWLLMLVLCLFGLAVAAWSAKNMFVGFGIEMPFNYGTFTGRLAIRLFFMFVYGLLLGWIPFLLIGAIRIARERTARKLKEQAGVVIVCFAILFLAAQSFATKQWALSEEGYGPIKIGFSLADLHEKLPEDFPKPQGSTDKDCFFVKPLTRPSLNLMMIGGHLVRLEVSDFGAVWPEKEMVKVGDSETQAMKASGAKVQIEDKPGGGHYLTVKKGRYGIRLVSDGEIIQKIYVGRFNAIQLEGCPISK